MLAEETLGYVTSPDPTNTDRRMLTAGSKNVLIDYQKKVKIRPGYTRLGVGNTALTNVRNAWTWKTSTALDRPQRFYDDELEVWLNTVDTVEINAWKRVANGWSTTEKMRVATWFDTSENLDLQLMVVGDANIYEWGGGVAVASAITGPTVTEAGDASNQMSSWVINGATAGETNSFVLYWTLTDSGGDRTVNVYKDSGGSNLVATGTRTGDGSVTLTEQNSSGITGSVTVAYSGDDTTTSANTLTLTYTLTKKGTTTFAQNRFYTQGSKVLVNIRTGEEFTYTGGETTTSLTGVTPNGDVDIQEDDVLVQKVVTNSNKPASSHTNHTIHTVENQVIIGSEDDEEIYISQNDDFTDYTFSAPRVAGEGGLLTLDDPNRAINSLGRFPIIFSGVSSIYKIEFEQIAVGSALAETIKVKKVDTGINQGALCHEVVVPIGNALAFLTNEVALRMIQNPEDLTGIDPKTFSNPIKPDFDNESWLDSSGIPDAFGYWYKNMLIFTAPQSSKTYILNFVEDEDGRLFRYWNPPQIWPMGPLATIDSGDGELLHGHSNQVPETYLLFDGQSDGQYDGIDTADKLPIEAKAAYAYDGYKKRALLKTFDEYYVEGEITPNTTDLNLGLNYDFGGATQMLEKTIDGSDQDILEGLVSSNSLGQSPLGQNPLGGLLNAPENARRFRVVFEIPKEDFHQIQAIFSTNERDRYWAIVSHGANTEISPRRNTIIRK